MNKNLVQKWQHLSWSNTRSNIELNGEDQMRNVSYFIFGIRLLAIPQPRILVYCTMILHHMNVWLGLTTAEEKSAYNTTIYTKTDSILRRLPTFHEDWRTYFKSVDV